MIIEETTTYAYKLKYIEDVSFGRIRAFAQSFVNELPQELIDDIFDQLNRGLDLLQNEPQMLVYLYSFGNMHEAKLRYAFDQLPDAFREQSKVNIIDYGCGQAIGTMCYADFLRENGIEQNIGTITLIEPSEICLRRAALHAKAFFPDAEIRTVCKGFDDLKADDIQCDESTPTLHILSNVLDILDFDLERFAKLIDGQLCGYNQFVCVEPHFNYSDKDNQMKHFVELLDGNISFSKCFEKGELNENKTWTAQILCFDIFKERISLPDFDTDYTGYEKENGVKDEFDVIYSDDGKKLIRMDNFWSRLYNQSYEVKYGTKIICDDAFSCCSMEEITIPETVIAIGKKAFDDCRNLKKITIPKSVISIGYEAFRDCDSLEKVIISDSVVKICGCAFKHCKKLQKIIIPNSVISLGWGAFSGCENLQEITIPDSIKNVGAAPFSGCKKLNKINSSRFIIKEGLLIDNKTNTLIYCFLRTASNIVVPDTITSIGGQAFSFCSSLEHITIPESVISIGNAAFDYCCSLKQITIPSSVKRIDSYAFSSCSSLVRIDILGPITSISDSTFAGCKSLKQFTIPESVTEIGNKAFSLCKSLTQIVIPKSVKSIGHAIFIDCDSLQKIFIPKGSIEDFTKMIKGNFTMSTEGLENLRILNKLVEQE